MSESEQEPTGTAACGREKPETESERQREGRKRENENGEQTGMGRKRGTAGKSGSGFSGQKRFGPPFRTGRAQAVGQFGNSLGGTFADHFQQIVTHIQRMLCNGFAPAEKGEQNGKNRQGGYELCKGKTVHRF